MTTLFKKSHFPWFFRAQKMYGMTKYENLSGKFEFPVFFSPIKKCGKSYFHNLYCYYRNFLHFLVINVYDTIWIFALKIICISLLNYCGKFKLRLFGLIFPHNVGTCKRTWTLHKMTINPTKIKSSNLNFQKILWI